MNTVGALINRSNRSASAKIRRSAAAAIESLESRLLLTAIVVNSTSDGSPAGLTTLREAITMANANTTSPTTITFDPTVFATPQTIVLTQSASVNFLEFSNIQQATTITGPAAGLTISGNNASDIFQIDTAVSLNVTGLTLTAGAEGAIEDLGGILTLNDSTLTGNTNQTAGGGFYQDGDSTTMMNDDTFSSNVSSTDNGGGIANYGGTLTLTNSTVSSNTIHDSGGDSGGGGIYNAFTMTLTNDTIANNVANGGSGGGIEDAYGSAIAHLTDCTISGNQCNSPPSSSTYGGGGIANVDAVGQPFTLANCIIAANTVSEGAAGNDAYGAFGSKGHNLLGRANPALNSGWVASDLTGTEGDPLDPDLGALANYGGSTLTMLPQTGSPAIDAGSNALIPSGVTTDQRGQPRIVNATVDIGAVEVQPPPTQLAFPAPPPGALAGAVLTPVVTVDVENASDAIVVADFSNVTLTIASGPAGATLGGTTTVAAQNGVATFGNLTLSEAGAYTLTATDGALTSATSMSFSVTQAIPSQVAFPATPPSVIVGTTLTPAVTVDVEDSSGAIVATDFSNVTLAIASGPAGATLDGTTTVAAQDGVAIFSNLSLSEVGAYTLTASDGALASATSMSFNATPVPPSQVAFAATPPSANVGATLSPAVTVDVENPSGATVATDSSNVTLTIASGPAGATLGGTTIVAAQDGVATFGDLSLSEAGAYTLTASDGALTSATSASFNVIMPSPLVPTLGSVSVPSSAVAGGKLTGKVPVVISNQGIALKGSVTVNLFADTGTSLNGSQALVTKLTKNVSLKVDKTLTFSLNFKSLPSTLPDGTYYLLAEIVDPSGLTNVAVTTQTVLVAAAFVQPAVSIGAVTPASIASGKSGSILVTLTNNGNVAASGVDVTLSPSSDGATPLAGVILESVHSGAKILPGKSKTFKLHFKVTGALATGNYFPYISVSLGGVSTTTVGTTQFAVG